MKLTCAGKVGLCRNWCSRIPTHTFNKYLKISVFVIILIFILSGHQNRDVGGKVRIGGVGNTGGR
jgi:hypothetical protein